MKKNYLLLKIILIFSFYLRTYSLDWDQSFHLHPDERTITMFTLPLQFPNNWNPHFFAYGSFPLYLLRIAGNVMQNFNPLLGQYAQMNLLGRAISAFFDLGTLILVFLIGKKLWSKNVGILGSLFYGISVLPIQLSHFYAVDTILTFFILLTLYCLILFYEKPTAKKALFVGISFGFALASKISATVLIASIVIALIIDFVLIFLKNPHRPKIWFPHVPKLIKKLFTEGLVIIFITFITFIILEPYTLLDFKTFWQQTLAQQQMTYDPFTFPYTLQYVGKTPYLYELKNIFLWGQGPLLALISFLGTLYVTFLTMKQLSIEHLGWWRGSDLDSSEVKLGMRVLIILVFFFAYFITVGRFAIGFMRYMLPIYPLLSLFGAVVLSEFYNLIRNLNLHQFSIKAQKINFQNSFILYTIYFILYTLLIIWPLSFLNIYSKQNTRVLASTWINGNIPSGKSLAIEHWDDSLPLFGQEKYTMINLPLYEPDTNFKWEMINNKVARADYIIIASNRLYVPLGKLTNCEKLPVGRCYKKTAEYYKKLFNGTLGFKKVAEFKTYPKFSFPLVKWKYEINDSSADESFTVYDHPKVIIFKKYDRI